MDGIGNPVGLITDFALSSYTYTFDPYGAANLTAGGTGNGAAQNPYLFKAGIQDRATGLVKFGLRWYNPVTGTWTQQDTLDTPLDPANANRYAYAGGDPVNGSDPSGRIGAALLAKLIAAAFAGGSLLTVLSGSNLVSYVAGSAIEFACDAIVGGATAGVGLVVGAIGCGVVGQLVSAAIDTYVDENS
ncbi:RHS repeat-associated core domain-containing protein [uncultured Leifsonia sp.]|uniref:RHS repeat-associated core domain-containing protein n=2 Tax=Leifsonia TaxID=110932 RepID=UPI0026205935|nr:RHS repeat-associated core domain-containing protein [uncultured Leifsonia sp.]